MSTEWKLVGTERRVVARTPSTLWDHVKFQLVLWLEDSPFARHHVWAQRIHQGINWEDIQVICNNYWAPKGGQG